MQIAVTEGRQNSVLETDGSGTSMRCDVIPKRSPEFYPTKHSPATLAVVLCSVYHFIRHTPVFLSDGRSLTVFGPSSVSAADGDADNHVEAHDVKMIHNGLLWRHLASNFAFRQREVIYDNTKEMRSDCYLCLVGLGRPIRAVK